MFQKAVKPLMTILEPCSDEFIQIAATTLHRMRMSRIVDHDFLDGLQGT
jgi:hypothetical protein